MHRSSEPIASREKMSHYQFRRYSSGSVLVPHPPLSHSQLSSGSARISPLPRCVHLRTFFVVHCSPPVNQGRGTMGACGMYASALGGLSVSQSMSSGGIRRMNSEHT
jgi:hypothetical protein